jgi:hypothetical protein
MNEGLFKKHIEQILLRESAKKKIIDTLKDKTGVELEYSEVSLAKKIITISTSSVKKSALLQKRSKKLLQELGYTLKI